MAPLHSLSQTGTHRHHCVECGLGCERHGVKQILGLRLSPSPEAFRRPPRMRRFEVLEAVARPGREAGTCSGRRERGWRKEVRKRRLWLEKRKRSGRGCRLFRGRTWWNDDEACSGSLAHRRVGDRACLTCRCACGGGVVVWWERGEAGSRVGAGSGGAGGLIRGLTRCIGGCGILDSCESASGAGRIDTSEAARFALRGDAFSVRSDRLARALARRHASGQPDEARGFIGARRRLAPHPRPCRLRDASHRGFCSGC
jgi:hypothetical protein